MTLRWFRSMLFASGMSLAVLCYWVPAADIRADEPESGEETDEGDEGEEKEEGESKEGEEADDEVSLDKLPEGDAADLLQYIADINQRPEGLSIAEQREYATKVMAATEKAADKIIEIAKEDDQLRQGVIYKFQTVNMRARMGDKDAADDMKETLDNLRKDERSVVKQIVWVVDYQQRLMAAYQGDETEKQLEPLVDELEKALASDEAFGDQAGMAMMIAQIAQQKLDSDKSLAILERLTKALTDCKLENASAVVGRLDGMLRQLKLIGSEMELEGETVDKEEFNITSLKGKVILVDYWATWCGPCIQELPNVVEAYGKYHEKGFEIVGVSLDDDADALRGFIKDNDLPWVNLFSADPEATGWQHPMATKYGVNAIPFTVLVGADGKVIATNVRGEALQEKLAELFDGAEGEKEGEETADSKDGANGKEGGN